jgi:hypothetical protein
MVKEGKYHGCVLCLYKNRTIKLVEIGLRRAEGG